MRQKTRNHLSLQNSMAVELYSKSMASSFLTNKQNDPISRMSDLSVLLSQWCHFVKPTESFQILYIDSLVSFSFFRVYNTYLLSPLPLFLFYFWFAFLPFSLICYSDVLFGDDTPIRRYRGHCLMGAFGAWYISRIFLFLSPGRVPTTQSKRADSFATLSMFSVLFFLFTLEGRRWYYPIHPLLCRRAVEEE